MGAQFNFQFVPHWKTVAKKNEMLHMVTITIMAQQKTWNDLPAREKILFQRRRSDILIRPKVIFSIV